MIAPLGKEDASHYFGHFIHSKDFMDGKRSINIKKRKQRRFGRRWRRKKRE
jgi:hypothetical protein